MNITKNQKYAVEGAVEAVEAWFGAHNPAALNSDDRAQFIRELVGTVLQAAYERNLAGRAIEAKTTTGQPIVIRFWDAGDTITGWDDSRGRFPVYTSKYLVGDQELLVQVDKRQADASGDLEGFRLLHELAALSGKGIDITSLPFAARHTRVGAKM
jgi:hypothetical protein